MLGLLQTILKDEKSKILLPDWEIQDSLPLSSPTPNHEPVVVLSSI